MFHDINKRLVLLAKTEYVVSRELLYADDTVLMSSSVINLQQLVNAVATEGAAYGLEINWMKTFQMSICTNAEVTRPDGTALAKKREIMYLGGMISCDVRAKRELT